MQIQFVKKRTSSFDDATVKWFICTHEI